MTQSHCSHSLIGAPRAATYFDLGRGVQMVGEEDCSLDSEAKDAVGLDVPGCVKGGLGGESNRSPEASLPGVCTNAKPV
jgi:hypothetical protein